MKFKPLGFILGILSVYLFYVYDIERAFEFKEGNIFIYIVSLWIITYGVVIELSYVIKSFFLTLLLILAIGMMEYKWFPPLQYMAWELTMTWSILMFRYEPFMIVTRVKGKKK